MSPALRGALLVALYGAVALGAAKRLEAGERAPEVELEGLDGKKLHYAPPGQEETGPVTVVAFVDPDQEATRRSLSELAAVRVGVLEEAKDVRWLLIASGELSDAESTALADLGEARKFFEIGLDPERTVYAKFGVVALPTTFVVGKDGIVVSAHPGRSASYQRDVTVALRTALGLEPLPDAGPEETDAQKRVRRLVAAAKELARRRRHEEAATRLTEATELCPDDIALWLHLGDEHLQCRKGAEARTAFEQALKLDEKSRAAKVGRACALAHEDDLDAAEKAIREALRKPPQEARLYYALGLVLQRRDDDRGAAEAFREAYERTRAPR